ncbi:unnamed protein product [Cunninghamella blakesleeana]
MRLPNEILFIIFDYINNNKTTSIHDYGLVCKLWYKIIHHPKFYTTIKIKSYQQLLLFLKWQSIHIYNEKPIGYFIKHITLTFHDILSSHHMLQLQLACPFLLTIHYIPSTSPSCSSYKMTYPLLKHWKHLIHLPLWHKESLIHCIESLGHQLTSLHTFISSSSSSSSSERTISPFDRFPFLNVPPSYYCHLKELYLDNPVSPCHDNPTFLSKRNSMNQSTLEIIHQKCPVLEKLIIQHIHLFYDPFSFDVSKKQQQIEPNYSLTTLELNYLYIIHPECFCYLFKKFPSLTHFKMIFFGNASSPHAIETTSILMNTLTHGFPHLMTCDILFDHQ